MNNSSIMLCCLRQRRIDGCNDKGILYQGDMNFWVGYGVGAPELMTYSRLCSGTILLRNYVVGTKNPYPIPD